jgi:hypothetical protein
MDDYEFICALRKAFNEMWRHAQEGSIEELILDKLETLADRRASQLEP